MRVVEGSRKLEDLVPFGDRKTEVGKWKRALRRERKGRSQGFALAKQTSMTEQQLRSLAEEGSQFAKLSFCSVRGSFSIGKRI